MMPSEDAAFDRTGWDALGVNLFFYGLIVNVEAVGQGKPGASNKCGGLCRSICLLISSILDVKCGIWH